MNQKPPRTRLEPRVLSGEPVDPLPPALYPSRSPRAGYYARLEPVDSEIHGSELYRAGHSDERALRIWDYMAYGPFDTESSFHAWLRQCSASADTVFYAVIDDSRSSAQGMASLMDIQPIAGSIEIGHIWFAPALQRSREATEALFLLMEYALGELRYRRLQWKCNALNQASRDAALRLGFAFEGVLYQHQIPKGRNRDTAYYSILDYEWPLIREQYVRWLDASNFDEAGRQRCSLSELNRTLRE